MLRCVLLFSLSGFLVSFVVLGHIESTLLPMYALASLGVIGYTIARGLRNTIESFIEYLSSWSMAPRWLFLALGTLSLLWVARPGDLVGGSGLTRVLTLVLIQISGWVVYDATRHLGQFENVLRIIFYSAALGAVIALLDLRSIEGYRIRGLFGNPNTLAITGTLGILAFIGYLTTVMPRGEKALALLLVVALHVAVFASGSRKGVLGLVFIWLTGLALRRTRRSTLLVIGLTFAIGFAGFSLAPRPFRAVAFRNLDRLGTTLMQSTTSATIDYSTAERTRFVEKGLELMTEAPLFGHGLDAFRTLSGEGTYAHNNYVDLGVGVGLLGVLLFYLFPLSLMYRLAAVHWGGASGRGQFAAFGIAALGLILVMDIAAVTYVSKFASIVAILLAGQIDATGAPRPCWRAW